MPIQLAPSDKPRGRLATHVIPPMTDPLGKHWQQPRLSALVINDTHVYMERDAFQLLSEYSNSKPSGVYPGKMWKSDTFDPEKRCWTGQWELRWYGIVPGRPTMCSNNWRHIVLLPN